MALFAYECDRCSMEYIVKHSREITLKNKDDLEENGVVEFCECCEGITRILKMSFVKTDNKEEKTRHRLENKIEDMKQELKITKKDLQDKRLDNE